MKVRRLSLLILGFAAVLFTFQPKLSWAGDDGATLFKTKCAMCHGVDGAGKPAIKAPSLISADAKKMPDADLTEAIANGGKEKKPTHMFAKKGMTPEQIKSVVAYIRTLQK